MKSTFEEIQDLFSRKVQHERVLQFRGVHWLLSHVKLNDRTIILTSVIKLNKPSIKAQTFGFLSPITLIFELHKD
jgi:hypothetical protein